MWLSVYIFAISFQTIRPTELKFQGVMGVTVGWFTLLPDIGPKGLKLSGFGGNYPEVVMRKFSED